MVKILHAADLHLDSAFRGLREEESRRRRQESRVLVERMVDYANDHGAELMLLCGDLFDASQIYAQTGEMLAAILSRFSGQVIIAPGNHDPYTATSAYERVTWPDNVHIFTAQTTTARDFPHLHCRVYGAAFTRPDAPAWEGVRSEGYVRIGVLHGDVGVRESRYRTISPAAIADSGLTYLALGHVHQYSGIQKAGNTCWAYPGCLEGRGFDETGPKGFLFGTVDDDGVQLDFVPFARYHYEILAVDVTGADPLTAVERQLPLHTETDSYRIILQGKVEQPVAMATLREALSPRFFALELRDQTCPACDIWEHCGEDTLRGLFLQQLRLRYETAETDAEKLQIEQAVRFGLAALENREM